MATTPTPYYADAFTSGLRWLVVALCIVAAVILCVRLVRLRRRRPWWRSGQPRSGGKSHTSPAHSHHDPSKGAV